jgi:hypothetical protein
MTRRQGYFYWSFFMGEPAGPTRAHVAAQYHLCAEARPIELQRAFMLLFQHK